MNATVQMDVVSNVLRICQEIRRIRLNNPTSGACRRAECPVVPVRTESDTAISRWLGMRLDLDTHTLNCFTATGAVTSSTCASRYALSFSTSIAALTSPSSPPIFSVVGFAMMVWDKNKTGCRTGGIKLVPGVFDALAPISYLPRIFWATGNAILEADSNGPSGLILR